VRDELDSSAAYLLIYPAGGVVDAKTFRSRTLFGARRRIARGVYDATLVSKQVIPKSDTSRIHNFSDPTRQKKFGSLTERNHDLSQVAMMQPCARAKESVVAVLLNAAAAA